MYTVQYITVYNVYVQYTMCGGEKQKNSDHVGLVYFYYVCSYNIMLPPVV